MEVTINQLMEMTGKSFRTIKAKLEKVKPVGEDGRGSFYSCKEALTALYTTDNALGRETFLLEKAKREKAEIEVAQLRGTLVSMSEVIKEIDKEYTIIRAHVRAIPTKLAKPLSLLTDPHEVFQTLSETVDECLSELTADARYKLEHDKLAETNPVSTGVPEESDGEPATSATVKPGAMGRHLPVSEPRVEFNPRSMEDVGSGSGTRSDASSDGPEGEEDHRDGADSVTQD